MKKLNWKSKPSDFENDYSSNMGKKSLGSKDKSSKKRLSIYDDYEDEEEEFVNREKFKNRHK